MKVLTVGYLLCGSVIGALVVVAARSLLLGAAGAPAAVVPAVGLVGGVLLLAVVAWGTAFRGR
jgi:hypothetical protein